MTYLCSLKVIYDSRHDTNYANLTTFQSHYLHYYLIEKQNE